MVDLLSSERHVNCSTDKEPFHVPDLVSVKPQTLHWGACPLTIHPQHGYFQAMYCARYRPRPALLASLILMAFALLTCGAMAGERSDIFVILTDDMNFSGPGRFGGEVETPGLDAL